MADVLRRRAALRVLGLTEKDLEPDESSVFVDGLFDVNKDLEKVRQGVHERKRQLLREEVTRTAAALADEDVEQILAISKAGRNVRQTFGHQQSVGPESVKSLANMTPHMQELMQVEYAKINEFREKKKQELQKSMEEEMKKKELAVERMLKAESEKKRLKDIADAKKAAVAGDAKARAQKHAHLAQALARAEESRAERLADFEQKLNAADTRVSQQLARNASDLASKHLAMHEKGDEAVRRKNQWEQDLFNKAVQRMDDRAEKEAGVDRTLLKIAEDVQTKADAARMKFLKKMMDTQQRRYEREQADHSAFLESEERKKRVREQHADLLKEKSGDLHTKLAKGRSMALRNQKEQQDKKEEIRQQLEKSIQEDLVASAVNANKQQLKLQADTQRRQASRQIVTDIVKDNKKRIQKANEYNSYQTLAKVCSNNGRIDELLDRRRQVVLARVNAQRESMIERHRMERAFEVVKDSQNQKRVNAVLETLGMAVATAEGKEGEEPASPAAGKR